MFLPFLLALTLSGAVIAGPGAVDGSFIPPAPNGWVHDIAVQPDGKILVAGEFTTIGGMNRSRIARLIADGTVDPSFEPGVGPNNLIRSLAVLPDGQIVIVGEFTSVSGTPRNRYARLNTNGTHDVKFAVTQPALLFVTSPTGPRVMALPDGRSLLTGMQIYFTFSPLVSRAGMKRFVLGRNGGRLVLHDDRSMGNSDAAGVGQVSRDFVRAFDEPAALRLLNRQR